jgi:hypothetical protein
MNPSPPLAVSVNGNGTPGRPAGRFDAAGWTSSRSRNGPVERKDVYSDSVSMLFQLGLLD